jgi:hypothetical protein
MFEAVQARLAAQAVARRCRVRSSPALLTGRLFDDRGNRMSPSHANKGGVRYRYYISQAGLQRRAKQTGSISRVPAAEIEALIVTAVRNHFTTPGAREQPPDNDRELVERYLERAILMSDQIKVQVRQVIETSAATEAQDLPSGTEEDHPTSGDQTNAPNITIPWTGAGPVSLKGIIHVPAHNTPLTPSRRDAVLIAIAKARKWVDDLAHGRVANFAVIARHEGKGERHVRRLAPLASLSPRIVSALIDGTASANLNVTALVRVLPYSWAEQERRLTRHLPVDR